MLFLLLSNTYATPPQAKPLKIIRALKRFASNMRLLIHRKRLTLRMRCSRGCNIGICPVGQRKTVLHKCRVICSCEARLLLVESPRLPNSTPHKKNFPTTANGQPASRLTPTFCVIQFRKVWYRAMTFWLSKKLKVDIRLTKL